MLAYNLYWLAVMLSFSSLRYHEVRGVWPWQWTNRRKTSPPAVLQQRQELQLSDIAPVSPLHPTTMATSEVALEKAA